MACNLCGQKIIAPVDHLAYQHGIDNPINRYAPREVHIAKMHSEVVIQHLVQDAAELNKLMADILAVSRKLDDLNVGYQNRHGLLVIGHWETDRNHPSLTMNRQKGQTKQALVEKLVGLRGAGLRRGTLCTREGSGTYGEVLAELKGLLARLE